jgi:hypothetical protein
MKIPFSWLVIGVGVMAAPVAGIAQVTEFGAQKSAFYEQTVNDKEPTKADKFSLYAFLTVGPDQVDQVLVSTVASYRLTHRGGLFKKNIEFDSLIALDKKFPVGDAYTFKAKGGELNGESGALPIQANAFPAVAYLTGNELTELKDLSLGSNVTVNFAVGTSGAASTGFSLAIYDKDALIYSQNASADATSITIPAYVLSSVMKAGVLYQGQLANYNTSEVTATGSFTGATNSDGWVTTTTFGIKVK